MDLKPAYGGTILSAHSKALLQTDSRFSRCSLDISIPKTYLVIPERCLAQVLPGGEALLTVLSPHGGGGARGKGRTTQGCDQGLTLMLHPGPGPWASCDEG